MDDDELLRRCQTGDDEAFGALATRWQERLFRLAFRVLADEARAEDAAADALAAVWSRCRSWRGDATAGTWIHQVAWRVILDHHRRRKRWWRFWELDGAATQASREADPASVAAQQDEHAVLNRLLAELSPEDRALVHWHYYEGQSLAEIGAVLGVSRDALKMRLGRARAKLRQLWGSEDG